MEYSVLAEIYEKLETTSAKLKKTEILAGLFKKTTTKNLQKVVLLSQGIVFSKLEGKELGIASQMMVRAIAKAAGFSIDEIEKKFRKTGDLGLAAEECIKSRKQVTLLSKKLITEKVFDNLQKLASVAGVGSQDKKLNLIAELLVSAKPKEARYIVRTILEEMRMGVAEGIIRDAIFNAFLSKPGMTKEKKKEVLSILENAWNLYPDFGEIARIAKEQGITGLKNVKLELGKSVQVMLAEKIENLDEAFKEFGKLAIEVKYDGMRAQIHKKNDKIWIYTRRLEDVTKQFPELVELCQKSLKPKDCIVDGEVLAIDKKSGKPLPFQMLSQRIQRKYDIEKMVDEIPIQIHLFDIVYLDGKMLFDVSFAERRKILEKTVEEIPNKFQLAKQLITDDVKVAKKFYDSALKANQEGVMVKNLHSKYIFGRHVGGWYKVKPVMETLDLAIVAATLGEGLRAKWLSSYVLACRDPNTGKFLTCGMMGTGLTEQQFESMTKTLKPLVESEKGREVKIKPKIVVEVAFQEIQKSPKYTSGLSLRFPRMIRIRYDKGPLDADTKKRVEELFISQGQRG